MFGKIIKVNSYSVGYDLKLSYIGLIVVTLVHMYILYVYRSKK